MNADLQAAIAASLADQGGAQSDDSDVVCQGEDVFSVEMTDTDGDTILFMLVDGDVQQYVNGNLEIPRVAALSLDESTGRVQDSKGRFTVPPHLRARLQSLKALLSKAGVEITPWQSSEPSASHSAGAAFDDDGMEAALEASIAETRRQNNQLCLDREREHVKDNAVLRQHDTINQFHTHFSKAISKYQAPSAICGYMTIAHCRLLRKLLEGAPDPLPLSALRAAGRRLITEVDSVSVETERAMRSIAQKRKKYMDAHPQAFASASERRLYLRAWVANFEISDELREDGLPQSELPASSHLFKKRERESEPAAAQQVPSLHFARFNEYPQKDIATHEERARILSEQQRFGGCIDAKGESFFDPPATAYILERFSPPSSSSSSPSSADSELLTPAEWQAAEARAEDGARVFAVDLNGHYAAAVVAQVWEEDQVRSVVQVYNTTEANYLDGPMPSALHGFVFPSSAR